MTTQPASSGKMSPYMSDKLRILSFLSIILVLYVHMYYTEGEHMSGLRVVENFWRWGLCPVAVPLFFVISGYLFFLHCPTGVNSIWPKLHKRARTLLVPYLIMNTLALLFYVLNLIIDYVPALGRVVNFRILETMQGSGVVQSLFGFYWSDPVAFQLWFIRDLLVVILFAPIIYCILKYVSKNLTGIMIFLVIESLLIAGTTFSTYFGAAFWFLAGGFMAMHPKIRLANPTERLTSTLLFSILTAVFAIWNTIERQTIFEWLIPLVGIAALWTGYDALNKNRQKTLASRPILSFLCTYTFFVYLVHEPLLNILKKLPLLVSRSEVTFIISYIIIPVLFYVLAAWLGRGIKGAMPKAYRVFTGGR